MKPFYFMLSCLVAGCSFSGKRSIRDFIPGVYTRQSESEFSKAYDTLRIGVYDPAANTYVVSQYTGYQLIKDGRLQPKLYKNEREIAVYDETTHQLQELNSGRLLVFSPENGTVLAASAEYQKIK
jgi:hypothetical protein